MGFLLFTIICLYFFSMNGIKNSCWNINYVFKKTIYNLINLLSRCALYSYIYKKDRGLFECDH